jgi:hypothetical protein
MSKHNNSGKYQTVPIEGSYNPVPGGGGGYFALYFRNYEAQKIHLIRYQQKVMRKLKKQQVERTAQKGVGTRTLKPNE